MPFDLQPTLKGQLVELRPLRVEDFLALYAVAADPLIWEQHPSPDRYQQPVFRVFFQEALECGGALLAADSQAGQVIGSSRFHGYNESRSEIEIGWTFLARSHWGGSYNGEMKRLMLRHVPVRRPRGLPGRPAQPALAASRGKDRRRSGGLETRQQRSSNGRL